MSKKRRQIKVADNGRSPYWIELTPDGKTMVFIYPWCVEDGFTVEQIGLRFYDIMGEPEFMGKVDPPKPYPPPYQGQGCFVMIFPHQKLPSELMDVGERMTSAMMLKHLGMDQPPGDEGTEQERPRWLK
jgi:hypothetical protein